VKRLTLPALPALLAAGWIVALFHALLSPARALASRDIPFFHLPLRAAFRELATRGLPVWNPWIHGGQPILSNPSYGAFYPPSWIVFLAPPPYALNLLVVLHAAIAFAGAWTLARRLGAGRGAAALAAVAYTGSGATLSLLSALTLFCSMAWFPWALRFADEALEAGPGFRHWAKPALLCGAAWSLQLLNGEPVTVVVTGLGIASFAAAAAFRRPAAAPRVLLPVAFAVALAAVQIVPTLGRMADSPRSGGLTAAAAASWSAPPGRLVELAFPRFWGDPARDQEGLFFGWKVNDRSFPYVVSLYPGLLISLLGLSALVLWPIPRRGAWALAAFAGAFLALGRHNPLYEALRSAVPVLAVLRFPEKFAILTVAALAFAGALGWQRVLDERRAGRQAAVDLPLALAGVLLATAACLTALLYALPAVGSWFVRVQGSPNLSPPSIARGLAFLRHEGRMAITATAGAAILLALCRSRRPISTAVLSALAVAFLGLDLWYYGHRLVRTIPAVEYEQPSNLVRRLPSDTRLWVEPDPADWPNVVPRVGEPELGPVRALLARLAPYSANLWRTPYALNEDYDLTLTEPARTALDILHADRGQDPDMAYRYLGAWNVGAMLLFKEPERWIEEFQHSPESAPVRLVLNAYCLPRLRFVPGVNYHRTYADALFAARTERYAVDRHENCVRPEAPPEAVRFAHPPEILGLAEQGGRIELRYRSASPAFLAAAMTYDRGFEATVDGSLRPVYRTALSQLGVELPAGEHRLLVRYRERLLLPGAAVTLLALAALAAALAVLRRSRPSPGIPPPTAVL
jgi:hypothetical protein